MMREQPGPGRHEEDRLSAFLDDELSDAEALRVTRHLAVCDPCLQELDGIREARAALRALPNVEPPPALFSDAVALSVLGRGGPRRVPLRLAGLALFGCMLVAGAAWLMGGEDGTIRPPVDVYVVDHVVRVGGGPVITPVGDPAGSGR